MNVFMYDCEKARYGSILFLTAVLMFVSHAPARANGSSNLSAEEIYRQRSGSDNLIEIVDGNWLAAPAVSLRDQPEAADYRPVEVGSSLLNQGFKGDYVWYRGDFDVPDAWLSDGVLLSLGGISVYDELWIGDRRIGRTGHPNPEIIPEGISHKDRLYFIPGDVLKAGKNVFEVRVRMGALGGMHSGPFFVTSAVIGQYDLYDLSGEPANALRRFLVPESHLNHFQPNQPIGVRLSIPGKAPEQGVPWVLVESDNVIREGLWEGDFSSGEVLDLGTLLSGNYQLKLDLTGDGRVVETLQIEVKAPEEIQWKIDPKLEDVEFTKGKFSLDQLSHGHFGFRPETNDSIGYNWEQYSGNGQLSFSVNSLFENKGPLIFRVDLAPMPQPEGILAKDVYFRPWRERHIWSLGVVSPSPDSRIQDFSVKSVNWVSLKTELTYDSGEKMIVHENAVSPFFAVDVDGSRLTLFGDMARGGLAPPTMAWAPGLSKPTLIDDFDPDWMDSNWMLVWFAGAQGWDAFDMPFVVTFERRPKSITRNDRGLHLEFENEAGHVALAALEGTRPLPSSQTQQWKEHLPLLTRETAADLSAMAGAMPTGVTERYLLDAECGALTLEHVFQHDVVENDWGADPLELSPIPSFFSVLARENHGPLISREPEPSVYAGLHGPSTFVKGNRVVYRFENVFQYVNEHDVPNLEKLSEDTSNRELIEHIRDYIDFWLAEGRLDGSHLRRQIIYGTDPDFKGPDIRLPAIANSIEEWSRMFLYAGEEQKADLQRAIEHAVRTQLLMDGLFLPVDDVKRDIKMEWPFKSTDVEVYSGIDMTHWAGLGVLGIWAYGFYFEDTDFLEEHWELVEGLMMTLIVSTDFHTGTAWDSAFGLRVGSNIEDQGASMAGLVAGSRIAAQLGRDDSAEFYATVAIRQMLGIAASQLVLDWVRENRPVVASTHQIESIEETERRYRLIGLEPNEHQGFYQFQISQNTVPPKRYHWYLITTYYPSGVLHRVAKEFFPEVVAYHLKAHAPRNITPPPSHRRHHAFFNRSIEYRRYVLDEPFDSLRERYAPLKGLNNHWDGFAFEALLDPMNGQGFKTYRFFDPANREAKPLGD